MFESEFEPLQVIWHLINLEGYSRRQLMVLTTKSMRSSSLLGQRSSTAAWAARVGGAPTRSRQALLLSATGSLEEKSATTLVILT